MCCGAIRPRYIYGAMDSNDHICRLCGRDSVRVVGRAGPRRLLHCTDCDLVFVPECDHVGTAQERERYATHHNEPDNQSYLRYLGAIADHVCVRLRSGERVLDFGSGEHQVLTHVLRGRGVSCVAHDPMYGIGVAALDTLYDMVVACESLEHVRDLPGTLTRVRSSLAPGARVFVHTRLRPPHVAQVAGWYYVQDPTHINLFSRRALEHVATKLGLRVAECDGASVTVLGP